MPEKTRNRSSLGDLSLTAYEDYRLTWGSPMSREVKEQPRSISTASLVAFAVGAVAFGAMAVGVLAIGQLAIGRLVIRKAHFSALEIDDLTVKRLHVVELQGSHS
jgi:hypothetical protein